MTAPRPCVRDDNDAKSTEISDYDASAPHRLRLATAPEPNPLGSYSLYNGNGFVANK